MKRLIFINGTMGAGKTTVCQELKKLLPPCAFLDGDWCWDMEPFLVTEETKAMVQENIVFLFRRFLACSAYENVIFCWVMHRQEILDNLLSLLAPEGVQVYKFTLSLSPQTLRAHLQKDVDAGLRTADILERSLERLPLYEAMDTEKICVDSLTPQQAAQQIRRKIFQPSPLF
ncbi:AAA family ATPase [Neglectibacter timonensis]|uniref:AAA family ATPase n=1 Tax=Neglectibacter timonensis TaxID=1776382 RepID=UPI003AB3C849